MPDKFDPDRMNSGNVDPTDLEAISEWLANPNTRALHDDLGRAFRHEPADVQRAEIRRFIASTEQDLAKLRKHRAAATDPELRQAFGGLEAALEDHLSAARRRLAELADE